ncbi:MAG TPA: sulfotransferase [Caulobacteraceae bacterium]
MADQTTQEPVGSLATALAHTRRLLAARPDLAQVQAREILNAVPGHPEAVLLLGVALRLCGDLDGARAVLAPLAAAQPHAAAVHFETGVVLAALGETRTAITALTRSVELDPKAPHAWRALGDQLSQVGDTAAADKAYARQIQASVNDPVLMKAAQALVDGKLAVTEHLLRDFLKAHPTDVVAMRMLAEAGTRLGRYGDVEKLLTRCLELAPSFIPARYNYAIVLYRQSRAVDALPQIELLLAEEPGNIGYQNLHAAALSLAGEYAQAIETYERVLKIAPNQPLIWLSYGHALRTSGRLAEAIGAYKHAIEQMPNLGEAYFSLANLKTVQFSAAEVEAMRGQLLRSDLTVEDQFHLHYALGKALEDAGDYAASFEHYAKGAALRRGESAYDPEENRARAQRAKAVFTPQFFRERADWGCEASDPIFVVGLPRSGSTLIEQILASHSAVEGTMELPDINVIAMRLGHGLPHKVAANYPGNLAELDAGDLRALGEEYLARTRFQRKTDRSLFIDKLPNNFQHVGLIHLMLPKAKIIDARRHPMAACFSAFKQHFARGQNFSYDLDELGRYYVDYVDLMAHFDRVLPGLVHRVFYERMVEDQETEVRALLGYCGLPFEDACLRFYENDRAVRTPSSEQVRQPIFRDGLDQWRRYEPWLDSLKGALGPVLDAYPHAPMA